MNQLEIRLGCKRFGGRAVLDQLSLTVNPGDRLVILGPSGAGKSTLLSVLAGTTGLDEGQFLVDGQDFAGLPAAETDRHRNRRTGFVFQRHCLLPQFSLLENIMLPVLENGPARSERLALAREWVARSGLSERADARPGEVSVGESQRAAILRALINQPAVLLADEPTGSLDRSTALATLDFLLERQAANAGALVLVTHDQEIANLAAAGSRGRILTLRDGVLHESA